MFPPRRWRHASGALLAALIGLASPLAATGQARAGGTAYPAAGKLVLAATVNGIVADEPVMVRREGGRAWMRVDDLVALKLRAGAATGEVALDAVPGLAFAIDDAAQTITLDQAASGRQRLSAAVAAGDAPVAITPNGWGAVVSYDGTAAVEPGARTLAASIDATVYTPRGYAFAGLIASAGTPDSARKLTRLDSGYAIADPDRLMRATLGDFVNGAASFSRPVRMGGVKIGTDFGLRPDLVTFPVPSLTASAALPSAVDLIVNGNRQATGEVRAGQFSVADIPVVTGVNTVTVAVRDALGRETQRTVTTYASRALLRRGLTAWSAEAGVVRTGYATDDDRYRSFAASGSIRHGLTDTVTIEGHGEASRGVAMAGLGASFTLGAIGMIDASAAASRATDGGRHTGHRLEIGFERRGRPVSITARYASTGTGWDDVASRYGSVTRRHSLIANIGFDLGRVGTVGAGIIDLGRGWVRTDQNGSSIDRRAGVAAPTTLVNATYSTKITRRLNLVGNFGTDLRQRRSLFASVGVLMVLGSRSSAYAAATARDRSVAGNAEYIRNALVPGDIGYRASVATGAYGRVAAGVEYLGRQSHVDAQVEHTDGQTAARVTARGSLILVDGTLEAANATANSFALVETPGQRGVTVYRDNHVVGVTDDRGRLFVPNLEPYQVTKFSIDPSELGNEVLVGTSEALVRPMERVGVPVRFALTVSRAAQVRLVDEAGLPLPVGSRALVGGVEHPVGLDGLLFLPHVAETTRMVVMTPGGRVCGASFVVPAGASLAHAIGPVTCATRQVAANDVAPRR